MPRNPAFEGLLTELDLNEVERPSLPSRPAHSRVRKLPIAMIEIFGPPVSPFVVKIIAAADYKGLSYTHQADVSVRDLSRLNPVTQKIPVVRFDGEVVFDSTSILRRFDQVQPTPALLSADATIAAQQRMLEDWSDESFYWYGQALRWSTENEDRTIAQNSRFVPAPLRPFAKPLLRRLVGKQPRAQGLGRLPYDMLLAELGERLDDLTLLLGKQAFFFSDRPSVADFAIYGVFSTGLEEEVTPDFAEQVSQRAALVDWRKRVEETTRLGGESR
jgi:glutathione S-transferase